MLTNRYFCLVTNPAYIQLLVWLKRNNIHPEDCLDRVKFLIPPELESEFLSQFVHSCPMDIVPREEYIPPPPSVGTIRYG
jgi:hypothetical protein